MPINVGGDIQAVSFELGLSRLVPSAIKQAQELPDQGTLPALHAIMIHYCQSLLSKGRLRHALGASE